MLGLEKEKEDISRLDGGEEIKVTCLSGLSVCVALRRPRLFDSVCVGPFPENTGGAAGESQGGSSEAAQPPPG